MNIGNQIKRFLFVAILATLIMPYLQMKFLFVDVKPLAGTIHEEQRTYFNLDNWFSEDYQIQTEKYLNQHFGFRNWLVRLSNQLKFSLFNKAQANGVIVGKDNYLYEIGYIHAFYGNDFLGNDTIDEMFRKLRVVQDSLKRFDTDIILVIAPGKASFFPEYIPEKYNTSKSISNRRYFVQQSEKYGIHLIDFSAWFIVLKKTAPYQLYPKTGIHWSYYGMNLAMDSLVGYIEELKNIDMPDMIWDSITEPDLLCGVDNDIEKGMNLLFPIENHKMPYPKITINAEGKTKPKAIIVADSYYWQIHSAGYSSSIFNKGNFWFYNKNIHTPGNINIRKTKEINLLKELKETDVIILMATEPVLKVKFWKFIDNCYEAIKGESEIEAIKLIILKDENWVKVIREKANNKNVSFEEMLQLDAEYIYREEQKK